jgi:hypothetical protein
MHATLIADLRTRSELAIALLIGVVSGVTGNITAGVALGLVVVGLLTVGRHRRHGSGRGATTVVEGSS